MHARDDDDSAEMHYSDLSTILTATNNFSDLNKLGEGGFGPVHKVKRLFIFGVCMFGNYLNISFELSMNFFFFFFFLRSILSMNLSIVTCSKVCLPILSDKFPLI